MVNHQMEFHNPKLNTLNMGQKLKSDGIVILKLYMLIRYSKKKLGICYFLPLSVEFIFKSKEMEEILRHTTVQRKSIKIGCKIKILHTIKLYTELQK